MNQQYLNYRNRIKDREIPVSADTSYDMEIDTEYEQVSGREFGTILTDLKEYLTVEEHLCITVLKNSARKKQNGPYGAFLKSKLPEKYAADKVMYSSLITHKKKKIFKLLAHLGALIAYKKQCHVDTLLKQILTAKQYVLILMAERRVLRTDMQLELKISKQSLSKRYNRAIERLRQEDNPIIKRYMSLLGNVLRFSRKRNLN